MAASDEAARSLQVLGQGATKAAGALGGFGKEAAVFGGAIGLAVIGMKLLADWTKRSAEAMQRVEQSSRNFATIIGSTTWADKLKAAQSEVDALTKQYEGMGGDTYSHSWTQQSPWEWLKRSVGAGTNEQFDTVVNDLQLARKNLERLGKWSQEGGQAKGAILGLGDLGRSIQQALLQPDALVTLTQEMIRELQGIKSNTARKPLEVGH